MGLIIMIIFIPNQVILIPKAGYSYYITKEGDTISGISKLFRINEQDFIKENKTIYLMSDQLLVHRTKWDMRFIFLIANKFLRLLIIYFKTPLLYNRN